MEVNVSIIYPNFDLKYSHIMENIEKWLNLKTDNNIKYELLVISRPIPIEELERIKKKIGNNGSIFIKEIELKSKSIWQSDNIFWNLGAELSKYENLLFVEGHVYPDEDFLMQLSSYISENINFNVLNFNPPNSKNSHIERVLDRWYIETVNKRMEIHHFNFLSRQAFLIKKNIFKKYGPLKIEFEQFAPPFLSSLFAENEIPIETVDFQNLTHILENRIVDFIPATRSYVRGYSIAETQIDQNYLKKYFGNNYDYEKIRKRYNNKNTDNYKKNERKIRERNNITNIALRSLSWLITKNKISKRLNSNLINRLHRLITIDEYDRNYREK